MSIKPEAAGCWTGGCSCGCRVRGVALSCGSMEFLELRERSDVSAEKGWPRAVGGEGEARGRRHARDESGLELRLLVKVYSLKRKSRVALR